MYDAASGGDVGKSSGVKAFGVGHTSDFLAAEPIRVVVYVSSIHHDSHALLRKCFQRRDYQSASISRLIYSRIESYEDGPRCSSPVGRSSDGRL